MNKIAVVILNWNGVKLLEQFLPSIVKYSPEATIYVADNASTDRSVAFVKYSPEATIYVADNASTDHSVAFVKENFPTVQIIQNESNFGFANGYNEALKLVKEPYYALVNSDIEVTENWLKPIIETFENEPKTAIIQPKILDFKNKEYFEYAGAAGGFIDEYGYPFCRGRIFETLEKDDGQYDDDCEIFWASGACFFIRNSVYKELNGFDGEFFAHQEEIDLCWRAFNKNHIIKYNGKSTVYHVGGATLNESNPRKTFLNFRNSLLMLAKNVPGQSLLKVLFVRMILDGIAGIRFLLQGKFSHFTAILKAHFYFYQLFSENYKKREKIQSKKYYKLKSIVYSYYFNNDRVFQSLF